MPRSIVPPHPGVAGQRGSQRGSQCRPVDITIICSYNEHMSSMRTVKPGPAGAVKGNAATGNEGSDHGEVAGGDTGKPPGRAEGMAGLAKGLAILEAFRQRRGRLTITDAAGAVGVSRATARRCLLTLVELGYLAHDGKYFRPTPRMLWLGSAYVEGASLPQLA